MARCTRECAEKTRQKLLDAAESVFLEKGVEAAALEDVAKTAGMTRGAVYWHFRDKNELFCAVHERAKLPLDALFDRALVAAEPLPALREAAVKALCSVVKNKRTRAVFTILMLKSGDARDTKSGRARLEQLRCRTDERLLAIFTRFAKARLLKRGVTPRLAATAFHGFLSGLFWNYLNAPKGSVLAKEAPKLVNLFLGGICR